MRKILKTALSSKLYNVESKQLLRSDKDHQQRIVRGTNTRKTNPRWRLVEIWHDDARH